MLLFLQDDFDTFCSICEEEAIKQVRVPVAANHSCALCRGSVTVARDREIVELFLLDYMLLSSLFCASCVLTFEPFVCARVRARSRALSCRARARASEHNYARTHSCSW